MKRHYNQYCCSGGGGGGGGGGGVLQLRLQLTFHNPHHTWQECVAVR